MHVRRFVLLTLVAQILLGIWGVGATNAAVVSSQQVASFPFSDDFESGISANWLTSKTNFGVVESDTDYPHSDAQSIFIGQRVAGPASAELILPVNLKDQKDVFLDFWWRATGNAPQAENGVYISDNDGVTWEQIHVLNANSHSYSHELINIATAAQTKGRTLNEKFRIRIFFHGTFFSNPSDGIVIDDFQLSARAGLIATFPFERESFEGNVFLPGFYPRSSGKGTVQFSTNYPHEGATSVFIGQEIAGAATAELELAINLKDKADVFLDFWWRATGNAPQAENGVYISDNDGVTWEQIHVLNANSHNYSHELINIATAAQIKGRTLNEKFRILIFFQGTFFNQAGDGIVVDDLRLTVRSDQLVSFPFALDSFETGSFQQGIYPRSSNEGGATIKDNHPHTGIKNISLGQEIAGSATSEVIFAINLASQPSVYLDFWWRATGNAPQAENGVYISDNDGTTWTQVKSLNTNSQNYEQEIIDIVSESAVHGKTLNNKFRIRIFFQGTFFSAPGDGIVVDDILIGAANPLSKAYLPYVRK